MMVKRALAALLAAVCLALGAAPALAATEPIRAVAMPQSR